MHTLSLRYSWCLLRYLYWPGGQGPQGSDVFCGSLFKVPLLVVVESNLGCLSFFPDFVQLTWPPSLLNCPPELSHCSWLGEAANAGAAVATIIMAAIRAATINKLMRLITLFPFLTTSTPRFMYQAVSGKM